MPQQYPIVAQILNIHHIYPAICPFRHCERQPFEVAELFKHNNANNPSVYTAGRYLLAAVRKRGATTEQVVKGEMYLPLCVLALPDTDFGDYVVFETESVAVGTWQDPALMRYLSSFIFLFITVFDEWVFTFY